MTLKTILLQVYHFKTLHQSTTGIIHRTSFLAIVEPNIKTANFCAQPKHCIVANIQQAIYVRNFTTNGWYRPG